jgi:hypothetical protein
MDPAGIFPVPYHPVLTDKTRDFRGKVHPLTRTQVPVKYYWIDFGLARHYQPDQRPPAERIIIGADKSPPEHTDPTQSCDPFPTDVYFVGNFVRQSFIKVRCILQLCHDPPHSFLELPQSGYARGIGEDYGPG